MQGDNATNRADRIGTGAHNILILRHDHFAVIFRNGFAGDGHAIALHIAAINQCLDDDGHTTNAMHVGRNIAPAGLEVRDMRRLAHDLSHILQREADAGLMRHGGQMERSIGRTTGGADNRRRVMQRIKRYDIARADIAADQFHHGAARFHRPTITIFIRRRRTSRKRQRKPDHFRNAGHGIRRELAAASARTWAGMAFQLIQFLIRHAAGGMLAHRFKHIQHGHVLAMMLARHDGPTIHEDRRHIQADHGHHNAGQGFVAARNADQRIIAMPAHRELNGIRNGIA